MNRILLACVITALFTRDACATLYQWSFNNHYYEAVTAPGGISWLAAKAAAEARGGYLATITSAAENNFVYSLVSSDLQYWMNGGDDSRGPWLGAFQPAGSLEPAGGWTWVTGEPFVYRNWILGEPNNVGPEDYLSYHARGQNQFSNAWNDLPSEGGVVAFIVEYVPEPNTGVLLGVSLVLCALRRRKKT